jgi:hypothetical protein
MRLIIGMCHYMYLNVFDNVSQITIFKKLCDVGAFWRTPKFFDRLKCEFKVKTMEE